MLCLVVLPECTTCSFFLVVCIVMVQMLTLCRFVLDGNKKLYLRSLWGDDHFSLFVTDGRYLWHGDGTLSTSLLPSSLHTD